MFSSKTTFLRFLHIQKQRSRILSHAGSVISSNDSEGDETAYRLEFESRGRRESSFQTELDGVRKLFQIRSNEFTMLKVETVVFRTVDDWDLKETLWSKE